MPLSTLAHPASTSPMRVRPNALTAILGNTVTGKPWPHRLEIAPPDTTAGSAQPPISLLGPPSMGECAIKDSIVQQAPLSL